MMHNDISANIDENDGKGKKTVRLSPKIEGPHTALIEFQFFWVTNQDGGIGAPRR